MSKGEIIKMLVEVVKSWQVLVVTIVLILYISLVNYTAQLYHKPGFSLAPKKKKAKPAKAAADAKEALAETGTDDLGIEQE